LQVGLWLSGTLGCQDIVAGALDDKIFQLFDFLDNRLPKSVPKVFLRVGYEFDNPWFGYSDNPSLYQTAFRKLVDACEDQLGPRNCHRKIAFVWHSWAAPRVVESLDEFYPGDAYVDWVGVSIFQQVYPWANTDDKNGGGNFAGGNMKRLLEVLEFATVRGKPIMIAESTPFGGMDVASTKIAKGFMDPSNEVDELIWELWFEKTIDLIEEFDISMWSYINCDWDSQPMWHGIGFGDTRISSSKAVTHYWSEKVLQRNSRFSNRIKDCDVPVTIGYESPSDVEVLDAMHSSILSVSSASIRKNGSHVIPMVLRFAYPCFLVVCGVLAGLLYRRYQGQNRLRQFHVADDSSLIRISHTSSYGSIR
jgi:hypothetical protein